MSTRLKIIVLLVLILFSVIALISYSTQRIEQALIDKTFRDTQILAENFTFAVGHQLNDYTESIALTASSPEVLRLVEQSNREFAELPDVSQTIRRINNEWNKNESFYNSIADNPLSKELFYRYIDYPSEKKGRNSISNIFVANRFGVVFAASGKPEYYDCTTQDWWSSATKDGAYFSDIFFDPVTSCYSVSVACAILDSDKSMIGQVFATISLQSLLGEIDFFNPASNWNKILLMNKDGRIYYDNQIFNAGKIGVFQAVKKDSIYEDGGNIYIRSNSTVSDKFPWYFLIEYSKDEILSNISVTTRGIDMLYLLIAFALAIVVFFFSFRFSKAAKFLRKTAKDLESGENIEKIKYPSSKEYEELAEPIRKIISTLKDKESSLKRTEKTLSAIEETSHNWDYWIEKDDKRISYCSFSCEDITGYKREDFYEDPELVFKIVHPEDRPQYNQDNMDTITLLSHERYFRIVTKEGGVKWIKHTCKPVYNPGGIFMGRLISNTDVTELQKIKDELVDYAAKLQKSNKELEQFAYVISHDLQEPLRKVISFGNLLEEDYKGKLDTTAVSYIDIMKSASHRMRELIDGILTYSRIGTSAAQIENIDFNSVVKKVLEDMELSIKDAQAVVKVGPLFSSFKADPVQMRQLFQNLISNSLKYHKKEVIPHVSIFMMHEDEKSFMLAVKDNGIGIDSKYFERIFIPFKRLHTADEFPGTGIGLSLCKKIVEKHNGKIELKSEPGIGTTFIITFIKN